MADKIFVDGLYVDLPREKAPKFIIANLSFNVKKFVKFIQTQENERGWVNIDIKESKNGNVYAEVNNWQKQKEDTPVKDGIPVVEDSKTFQEQLNGPAKENAPVSQDEDRVNVKDIPF